MQVNPQTALALAALVVASGCSNSSDNKAPAAKPTKHARRLLAELKRPYLSMRAPDAPGTSEFDRVPLDLWAPFRYEGTFGIFDPSRAAGLENAFIGLEVNSRGGPNHDYWGIYANPQSGGLLVSGEAQSQGFGSVFFPGATKIDGAIVHDGSNVRFLARESGSGAEFVEVGSVPDVQAFPLNPAIGTFDFSGNAEAGFDRLRVASNSAPPEAVTTAHAAMNAIFDAMAALAEVRYDLASDPAQHAAAAGHLTTALDAITSAGAAVEAVRAPGKAANPVRTAMRELRKVKSKAASTRSSLQRRGARAVRSARTAVANALFGLVKAGDAIVPDDLRESLPGVHETLK